MRSTMKQWEVFEQSTIWQDIKDVLEDWVDGIKAEVFDAESIEEVRKYQGRVEALGYFLGLPKTILDSLKYDLKEKEEQDVS